MKNKILRKVGNWHWTRYKIVKQKGYSEHATELYFGFYIQSSPCAVGGINLGIWNRNVKLILDLHFTSFSWNI